MKNLYTRFALGIPPSFARRLAGRSLIDDGGEALRLINVDAQKSAYSNAQIDDYSGAQRTFHWQPPLRLTLRARFSHAGAQEQGSAAPLGGTAGFGFWNDPFALAGRRLPALPRALWFFYASPPSNMALALDRPGWGWKAATFDAATLPFVLLAPTTPLAVPLMHIPRLYRRLWPIGQRALRISEAPIDLPMAAWHIYQIDWGERTARFSVDGIPVLVCDTPPAGPLGLVIWIDNQYMQITPQGRFGHGYLDKPGSQWLALDWLAIEAERDHSKR